MTPLDSDSTAPIADCAYHPGRAAHAVCAECARPICDECRQTVADKTVCASCVAAIRARVAAEMTPPVPAGVVNSWSPTAATSAAGPPTQTVVPMGVERPSISRLIAGAALGLLLGIVGVVVWVVAVALIKFDISLFAVGVGWLAGFGVVKGCGRGGAVPAILGAVIALAATLSGAFLLTGGHPGFFQWFCVAVGVYEGYVVPRRAAVR